MNNFGFRPSLIIKDFYYTLQILTQAYGGAPRLLFDESLKTATIS